MTSRSLDADRSAAEHLTAARDHERAGVPAKAEEEYARAIAVAEASGQSNLLAESLRRLGILRHTRGEGAEARVLCVASHEVAVGAGNDVLAAEALNTLGVMLLREGSLVEAKERFLEALALSGGSVEVQARAEQNLGILANIHGDLDEALDRYGRSLAGYQSANDEHGCALAYHNLGMVSADLEELDDADRYFGLSHEIATRAGDQRLQALCLLNRADVEIARQRFEEARRDAEASLVIFDRMGAREQKSTAYRLIGVVYRETGRLALAESRLRAAIELAKNATSVLHEADATRDLAVVYQTMGRNQDALLLLNRSRSLFSQLDARRDLVNVAGKVRDLEGTYLALVREWGQSIESSDSYTYGHCGRVADHAVAVAEALGLDTLAVTTIRLGAYLHDLGKVKVPHEVLNKAGPLTREEFEIVQMHPVWGIELLEGIDFPWDIKPIIRSHHEKYDGTGYPERLRGDEIPLGAQIVGIVDVYDALTTSRPYRGALPHTVAMSKIAEMKNAWSPAVVEAFLRTMPAVVRDAEAAPAVAAERTDRSLAA